MATDITSLTGSITLNAGIIASIAGTLSSANDSLSYQNRMAIAFGSGANQENQLLHKRITIAASTPGAVVPGLIDLQGLVNAFGHTAVLTKVKALLLVNSSTTAAYLKIGQNSGDWNGFSALFSTNTIAVQPGDCIYLTSRNAGQDVDGSHHTIGYESSSTTLEAIMDVIVVGVE